MLVDHSRITNDLADMIRIPSVNTFGGPAAEGAMADYFEQALRKLGLEIDSHEVSHGQRNVWGVLKGAGTGPTILLAGHLDTVGVEGYDNPFEPKIDDGKIFGRGSCDMKAGLAAYLEVIRVLQASGATLSGDVIVAGVVDEEHAMVGSKAFGLRGPKVDFAIVAEPSQLKIAPAHKGQILMTLRTRGVAAHSSMPEKGVNAIYHMARALQALQGYAEDLRKRRPDAMCGLPSFSVGVFRGGDNACSVPDFCEVDLDRRTIPGEMHSDVLDEMRAVLDAVQAQTSDFKYEFETPFLDLPPLATDSASPLMKAIETACQDVIGRSDIMAFPGSTDAPNFKSPTVICGAGNLEQCHSLNEYVDLNEIENAVRIYVKTIQNMQNI